VTASHSEFQWASSCAPEHKRALSGLLFIEHCTKQSARVDGHRSLKTPVTVFRRVTLEKAERIDQRSILRGNLTPAETVGRTISLSHFGKRTRAGLFILLLRDFASGFAQARCRGPITELSRTGGFEVRLRLVALDFIPDPERGEVKFCRDLCTLLRITLVTLAGKLRLSIGTEPETELAPHARRL
jgi:hypothetical protein